MARTGAIALAAAALHAASAFTTTLDPATAAHTYDGHGALSAGASSRLLWDYPEPQRSQILDYLFLPNFGANLHLLKVEIGGDGQSTDGTEPSPQHTRGEPTQCGRGYESWLLTEAKKRNPSILTYGLSWAVPHWIGNGSYFSADNIQYQTDWAQCVQELTGSKLDYIGIWNERSWGSPDYVVSLRNSLDSAGLSNTQIILPDGGSDIPGIISNAESNATFKDAIAGVGLHYPCNRPNPVIQEGLGKKFWASEDYSTVADWAGAGCWGRMLVQNYVRMNMTSTISWSLIWSVYPNFPYFGNGLMYAMEPWSGHYSGGGHAPGEDPVGDLMNGPVWTSAHFTQFTQPGWVFLSTTGGGSGSLPGGGSYVTLIAPSGAGKGKGKATSGSGAATAGPITDFSVIVETLEGDCLRCAGSKTSAQSLTFVLAAGMPGPGTVLQVWRTNMTQQFVPQPSVTVGNDRSFTVDIGEDEMVTVTTLTTGSKGSFPDSPIPPSKPFPMPYADSFNGYPFDTLAHYFSDNAGSFSVRNGSLVQMVPVDPGSNAWVASPDPVSLIGGQTTDPGWQDYSVTATVVFGQAYPPGYPQAAAGSGSGSRGAVASAIAAGRHVGSGSGSGGSKLADITSTAGGDGNLPATVVPCKAGDPNQVWATNAPASGYLSNTPRGNVNNPLCLNLDGCGSTAIYYQCVTSGGTCCGSTCYAGLQWTLPASGTPGPITSPLSGVQGQCLTVGTDGSIGMSACGGGNQSWTFTSATGQLALTGTGLCLATPASLYPTYAQVCGRIGTYSGFNKVPVPGYCVAVDVNGTWVLRAGGNTLATGAVPGAGGGYNSTAQPVILQLTMKGSNITASVSLAQVGQGQPEGASSAGASPSTLATAPAAVTVPDSTYPAGMAAVGSGFHYAAFDEFVLAPA